MTRFTDSPYERMMTRRPEGGKETSRPPSLPHSHPCYGCGNYGRPCVGICHRKCPDGSKRGGTIMAQHKLVIAEKPSVAQSLAAVIGATARKDGYLEGNGWRVSWCVGHLAGLADADSYDPKYAKWRYDDLPILPEHWQMVVGKDKKKQFDILKKLMNAPDVTESGKCL